MINLRQKEVDAITTKKTITTILAIFLVILAVGVIAFDAQLLRNPTIFECAPPGCGSIQPSYVVTITESPPAADTTWGACLIVDSQPQICVGPGTSGGDTESITVPTGSIITYICTAKWDSPSAYAFKSWGGAYDGAQCVSVGAIHITVLSNLDIIAEYETTTSTTTSITTLSTSTSVKTTTSTATTSVATTTIIVASDMAAYLPITLKNTQDTATPAQLQAPIYVDSLDFKGYEQKNLDNVEFFFGNGTIAPSWMQTGNTNTSTKTLYWVKIPAIAANKTINIFLGFAPINKNVLGAVTGEAPELSPTYGEYDSGSDVFSFYDNFAGTTLSSKWTNYCGTSGNTCTVDDGITITKSDSDNNDAAIYTTSYRQGTGFIDFYGTIPATGDSSGSYVFASVGTGAAFDINSNLAAIGDFGGKYGLATGTSAGVIGVFSPNSSGFGTNGAGFGTKQLYSIDLPPTPITFVDGEYNNSEPFGQSGDFAIATNDLPTPPAALMIEDQANTGISIGPIYWIRTRLYPPDGFLPTVTFGSLTNLQSFTAPAPSNTLLDQGQYVSYSVQLSSNSLGPYTVSLLQNGKTVQTLTGQVPGKITFSALLPQLGNDNYYVTAINTGETTSFVSNGFSSAVNVITVYPTLGYDLLSIAENPSSASSYWGACISWKNPSGVQQPQICAGNGTDYSAISVPQGSTVDYICTADWHAGSYEFVDWSGQYSGPQCVSEGSISIPISASYEVEGNYKLN